MARSAGAARPGSSGSERTASARTGGPTTFEHAHPVGPGKGAGAPVGEFHQPRFSGGLYHYDYGRFSGGCHFGFWAFGGPCAGCYWSPFFYFGFPYIYGPDVLILDVPVYTSVPVPDCYGGGYYLSRCSYNGLNGAVDDIKNAWLTGNTDLLTRHIDPDSKLAIYLDGKYSYSLSGADYRDMTLDAMGHISTASFTIYKTEQRSDGAYTVLAKHEFYDVDNNHKVAYVSYTLTNSDGQWLIVATGSSDSKLN